MTIFDWLLQADIPDRIWAGFVALYVLTLIGGVVAVIAARDLQRTARTRLHASAHPFDPQRSGG